MLGQKKFWDEIFFFDQKTLGQKYFWVKKMFTSIKNVGPENFLGPEKF